MYCYVNAGKIKKNAFKSTISSDDTVPSKVITYVELY